MMTEKTSFGLIQWCLQEESEKLAESESPGKTVKIISGTEDFTAVLKKIAKNHKIGQHN